MGLGGILYPLQEKRGVQTRKADPHPWDPGHPNTLSFRTHEWGEPQTFNIFSSPSIRSRRTGMSIPVSRKERVAVLVPSHETLLGAWTTFPRNARDWTTLPSRAWAGRCL